MRQVITLIFGAEFENLIACLLQRFLFSELCDDGLATVQLRITTHLVQWRKPFVFFGIPYLVQQLISDHRLYVA
jgi:hypothetical protein